jgi:hypothetical protein
MGNGASSEDKQVFPMEPSKMGEMVIKWWLTSKLSFIDRENHESIDFGGFSIAAGIFLMGCFSIRKRCDHQFLRDLTRQRF